MLFVFITIIAIAIVLFIMSFFVDDKIKKLEDQFEQFSITTMQDTYQLKRKVKDIEEFTENMTQNNVTNNNK